MFPIDFDRMANTHPNVLVRQFFQNHQRMLPQDMQMIVRAIVDVLHWWVNIGDTSIVTDSTLLMDMAMASEESDYFEETMESHTNISIEEITNFINRYRAIRALRSFIRLQEIGLLKEDLNPYIILHLENLSPKEIKTEKVIGDEKEDYLDDFVFTDEPLDDSFNWDDVSDFLNSGKDLQHD